MLVSPPKKSGTVNAHATVINADLCAGKYASSSVGAIPFADSETGYRLVLPTSSTKFRRMWREENDAHMTEWEHECERHGGFPLVLNTSSDPLKELTKFFMIRER